MEYGPEGLLRFVAECGGMPHMDQPQPASSPRLLARFGMYASAFGVFLCGWMAMKADDWRVMVGWTVVAGVAGLAAAALGKRAG